MLEAAHEDLLLKEEGRIHVEGRALPKLIQQVPAAAGRDQASPLRVSEEPPEGGHGAVRAALSGGVAQGLEERLPAGRGAVSCGSLLLWLLSRHLFWLGWWQDDCWPVQQSEAGVGRR